MKKGVSILTIILILIAVLFFIRLANPIELDDLTPGIPCESDLIGKANILWVIPDFENNSIAQNKPWCSEILELNKKLGMHGVKHSYNEFRENITQAEIQRGMEIFKECFGFYPTMFKPPQLAISDEEKKLIKDSGMELMIEGNQITHKVYHCNDSDIIKNWMVRIF